MSQDPFGEVPFFRELQRLLSASDGPVNQEIARQVAGAISGPGAAPADSVDERLYSDAVRELEVFASGYTRLPSSEPTQVSVMDRNAWVASTFTGWRWVIDRLASRFTGQLDPLGGGEAAGPGGPGPSGPSPRGPGGMGSQAGMGAAMTQVTPLLFGIQAGTLVGTLSTRAMGRYDLPIPRDDDGILFFVAPNISSFALDYGLGDEFKRWFALNQTVPHLVARSVTWLLPYWRGLVTEVVDAIEIDIADLQNRLMELQAGGLEAMEGGTPDILPVSPTARHQAALARVKAFDALLAGYARHATDAIAEEVIGDTSRFEESLSRYQSAGDEAEALLGKILGVVTDRPTKVAGTNFCAAVVTLKGIAALNKVWDAPDNLPSLEEIRDPFAWMERVVDVQDTPA